MHLGRQLLLIALKVWPIATTPLDIGPGPRGDTATEKKVL